jgi:hypothetical protein
VFDSPCPDILFKYIWIFKLENYSILILQPTLIEMSFIAEDLYTVNYVSRNKTNYFVGLHVIGELKPGFVLPSDKTIEEQIKQELASLKLYYTDSYEDISLANIYIENPDRDITGDIEFISETVFKVWISGSGGYSWKWSED